MQSLLPDRDHARVGRLAEATAHLVFLFFNSKHQDLFMECSKAFTAIPPSYTLFQGLPKAIFVNVLKYLTIKEMSALCTLTNTLAELILKKENNFSPLSSIPFVFCIAHQHKKKMTLHGWEILKSAFHVIYKSAPETGNAILQEICYRVHYFDISNEYADTRNEFKFYLSQGDYRTESKPDGVLCSWKAIESVACFPNLKSLVLKGCFVEDGPRGYQYANRYRHKFSRQAFEVLKCVMNYHRKAVEQARISNTSNVIHGWAFANQKFPLAGIVQLSKPHWLDDYGHKGRDTTIRKTSSF